MTESKNYKFKGVGLTTQEKNSARKHFKEYKSRYHIERYSDLALLEELVYKELISEQYKTKIKDIQKSKTVKEKNIIPRNLLEALDENLDKILLLKEKLGLFLERKESNWIDFWGRFQKKLQIYAQTHKAECTFKCPTCGEYALLLRKIDNYNTFNFNLLRGTFVYNKELMEEIEKGTLSRERVAKIFGCSVDYIDGLYNEVYLKEKRQDTKSD